MNNNDALVALAKQISLNLKLVKKWHTVEMKQRENLVYLVGQLVENGDVGVVLPWFVQGNVSPQLMSSWLESIKAVENVESIVIGLVESDSSISYFELDALSDNVIKM